MSNSKFDYFTLIVIWIFAVLLVNPIGNFPLNDDWSYAISVNNFLIEKTFQPIGWTSMTLFSQTIWGSIFGNFFGFSHSILRISTLVLSLIGIIFIYHISLTINKNKSISYFITLLITFNPLFFSLSFTFMTDIPFAVFSIISIFFYIKTLQNSLYIYFILGTLFAIIALLDRQIALFIPIAFSITNIIRYGLNVKILFQSFISVALMLLVLIGFNHWLELTNYTPKLYGLQINQLTNILNNSIFVILKLIINNTFIIIMYIGLFLSPLLLLWFISNLNRLVERKLNIFLSSTFIIIMTIYIYIKQDKTMPYIGNIFTEYGIGPLTLYDSYILNITEKHFYFEFIFKFIIIGLSLLGGIILVIYLIDKIFKYKENFRVLKISINQNISFFLLFGTLIYLSPILLLGGFDRYLIIPIILVSLSITLDIKNINLKKTKIFSFIILSIFILYSIVSTHDYLSWNKARWKAIKYLLDKNISPSKIDGGFEFNGLYLYNPKYKSSTNKSWWWVIDNKYIITFSKVDKYTLIKNYKFNRWIPFLKNNINILIRN